MKNFKFILLDNYPSSTKNQIRKTLKEEGYTDIRYSGNDGGFYIK